MKNKSFIPYIIVVVIILICIIKIAFWGIDLNISIDTFDDNLELDHWFHDDPTGMDLRGIRF
ncbi:hypothetical protein A3B60_00690 [Candidatus Peregrinibacteria bacterium RIFCSPLOWO2_01_FULL_39_12]|nr:MAG: hypothetical protein A3I58_03575 [Candidatus Peregrinibacteria bacterium RIFCSPLOWO2_02_FULL_39_10]OGJ42579.1 MAG: hypothetical protein A3B60_00690 [Candidatus Peregrinibacteria bacterium RIFCSPLOWO2_01_FULL_39_12]